MPTFVYISYAVISAALLIVFFMLFRNVRSAYNPNDVKIAFSYNKITYILTIVVMFFAAYFYLKLRSGGAFGLGFAPVAFGLISGFIVFYTFFETDLSDFFKKPIFVKMGINSLSFNEKILMLAALCIVIFELIVRVVPKGNMGWYTASHAKYRGQEVGYGVEMLLYPLVCAQFCCACVIMLRLIIMKKEK